jgi:hypothetical protein
MWWISSSGRVELRILRGDVLDVCCSGPNDTQVAELRQNPRIKKQLDALDPAVVAQELGEHGIWDSTELADHDANLDRLLWIACWDLFDKMNEN